VWANSAALQFAPASSLPDGDESGAMAAAGGSQPHDNMLPFQAITFVIALEGIFPPQN
jgi:microcystin-dependent protein